MAGGATQVGGYSFRWDSGPISALIQRQLVGMLRRVAPIGEEVARSLARVDTGAMRDSVHAVVSEPAPLVALLELRAGEGLPDARAVYNELGTSAIPAAPFVTPGGDAMVAALPGAYAAEIGAR